MTTTNVAISENWQSVLASDIIPGDTAWVLTSIALVFIMTPGLGFFYAGLARTKNALSLILACFLSMSIVTMQWYFFGYSLSFSPTSRNVFIGDFHNGALGNMGTTHPLGPTIPTTVFSMFQLMFAAITPALAFGASAERFRILPMMAFTFLWSTFVYDFVAFWIFSATGWGHRWGVLDYAGGSVVHINSAATALGLAIMCGKRDQHDQVGYGPHNLGFVCLGTALLWFGWLGFNGGSALAANERAGFAVLSTQLAGSFGGFTWMVLEHIKHQKKEWSAAAFCAGAIAGLATVTPGSGFITPSVSLIFGIGGGAICFFVADMNSRFRFDDALGVAATHGVGGFLGMLLTGIFAQKWIGGIDTTGNAPGGWLNHVWIQIVRQLAGSAAVAVWAFIFTVAICWVLNKIPGFELRPPVEEERTGMDITDVGEEAYGFLLPEVPLENYRTNMNRTGNTVSARKYDNTHNPGPSSSGTGTGGARTGNGGRTGGTETEMNNVAQPEIV